MVTEKRWLVKGCGVAFVCDSMERVKAICDEIIHKGGVPEVQELKAD